MIRLQEDRDKHTLFQYSTVFTQSSKDKDIRAIAIEQAHNLEKNDYDTTTFGRGLRLSLTSLPFLCKMQP